MTETATRRHGCHNREPFKHTVVVQHGWHYVQPAMGDPMRFETLREIPDPMSKNCQYTLHGDNRNDPACAGCRWKKPSIPQQP